MYFLDRRYTEVILTKPTQAYKRYAYIKKSVSEGLKEFFHDINKFLNCGLICYLFRSSHRLAMATFKHVFSFLENRPTHWSFVWMHGNHGNRILKWNYHSKRLHYRHLFMQFSFKISFLKFMWVVASVYWQCCCQIFIFVPEKAIIQTIRNEAAETQGWVFCHVNG